TLGLSFFWRRHARRLQRFDGTTIEKGEVLQICHDIPIVGVQPELIKAERRGTRRIEPDGTRFRLPELRARCRRHQRHDEPVRFLRAPLADQIDARGDVAPLIAAAQLECALETIEYLEEIARLEQQIAELGVGNSLLALEAAVYRVLLE